MYVVIFRARIRQLDEVYSAMAEKMRQLALSQYNCVEFTSITQGNEEIALSYWHSEADIQRWKQDAEHRVAQQLGSSKWYSIIWGLITRPDPFLC